MLYQHRLLEIVNYAGAKLLPRLNYALCGAERCNSAIRGPAMIKATADSLPGNESASLTGIAITAVRDAID